MKGERVDQKDATEEQKLADSIEYFKNRNGFFDDNNGMFRIATMYFYLPFITQLTTIH